ncbi:MAG: MFS transporter, partial [Lachnospiraceae bacterium]|nr:MFS transporter [Lachnospiraceae bacterium]
MNATAKNFNNVSMKEKAAYFIGECGSCGMFYYLTITLSTYFFTDVMNVSATTLGMVIIITRVLDLFSDLIVGSLVDRTQTRWGKARPWVIGATFPYAIGMVLLYCLPANWSAGYQIAYIVITYNLAVTICYTAENIPWGSLPALMTNDKVERSQLHSVRMLASPLGSAIGVSVAIPLVSRLGGTQGDWIKVMTLLACVGIVCNIIAVAMIKEKTNSEDALNRPVRREKSENK